jgi:periplasmic divalent cation tolerance protein
MKENQARIVLVTCGNLSEARLIAKALVGNRLAACVNILLNPAESVYRWKNKIQTAREYLLIVKSVGKHIPELQRQVHSLHSYEVPEFIVLPIVAGSRAYLNWLHESVKPDQRNKK